MKKKPAFNLLRVDGLAHGKRKGGPRQRPGGDAALHQPGQGADRHRGSAPGQRVQRGDAPVLLP